MSTDMGIQRVELQTLKPTWLQRRRMRNVTGNKESGEIRWDFTAAQLFGSDAAFFFFFLGYLLPCC